MKGLLKVLIACIIGGYGFLFAANSARADFQVGKNHYRNGAFADAAAQFRQGLQHGEPRSIYSLGLLYHQGLGVRQNHEMALDLWKHAARHGLVEATIRLAAVYEMGNVTARDLIQAYMWYSLAAHGGSTFGARQRERLAVKLNHDEMEKADLLKREWLAQLIADAKNTISTSDTAVND